MGSLWEAMFTPTNATSARCYTFFKLNPNDLTQVKEVIDVSE